MSGSAAPRGGAGARPTLVRDAALIGLVLGGAALGCWAVLDVASYQDFLWSLVHR